MSELVGPLPFYDRWVAENLPYTDDPYTNEVWTINGQHGVGRTTVSSYLQQWIEADGFEVARYSPAADIIETNKLDPQDDAGLRPMETNRAYDVRMAVEMVHPKNQGKLVLIHGRLGGTIGRELQIAADKSSKVDRLPANIHNVLLWASEDFRSEKLSEQGLPDASRYEERDRMNFGYVNFDSNSPYSPAHVDSLGNPVYDYSFKSPMYSPLEMARQIWFKISQQSLPNLARIA